MMLKFNEALEMVKKNKGLNVLTEGKTYFTVEDPEGFRAYCQVDVYGSDIDNTDYYKGYSFSTVHRPNRKTGTGWREITEANIKNENDFFKCLDNTLDKSKMHIQSGKEKMDTRQPKDGFLW